MQPKPEQANGPSRTTASGAAKRVKAALADRPKLRKRCLDLRSRIVLTEEGARFFAPRVGGLHRFASAEGEARYGFRLRSVDMPWLKRLLAAGFIDKADFPVREMESVKNEISDLCRLMVFSVLFGRFNASAAERAVATDVVAKWNRLHPHQSLDARNAGASPDLRAALEGRRDLVRGLQQELLDPVLRDLSKDAQRSAEDIHRLGKFARELTDRLDPVCWFALLGSPAPDRLVLISDFRRLLASCINRSSLADYLSLMTLELMGAAERATLVGLLGPSLPPEHVRVRLEDPASRSALLAALPNGLSASMVWSFSRRWSLGRWRYRLKLGLYDGSSSYEDTKRLFEERGRAEGAEIKLQNFYDGGSGPYGDDGLGWYYFSFLREACDAMGIAFEASVRQRSNRRTASVHLSFIF